MLFPRCLCIGKSQSENVASVMKDIFRKVILTVIPGQFEAQFAKRSEQAGVSSFEKEIEAFNLGG